MTSVLCQANAPVNRIASGRRAPCSVGQPGRAVSRKGGFLGSQKSILPATRSATAQRPKFLQVNAAAAQEVQVIQLLSTQN